VRRFPLRRRLGKLGGSELNYSSDIDVIFVYAEERDADDREIPGHTNISPGWRNDLSGT